MTWPFEYTRPAINQLYLDWGVTNQAVKKEIAQLLSTEQRERLWVQLEGNVPATATQLIGHHTGFRGVHRRTAKRRKGLGSMQAPVRPKKRRTNHAFLCNELQAPAEKHGFMTKRNKET